MCGTCKGAVRGAGERLLKGESSGRNFRISVSQVLRLLAGYLSIPLPLVYSGTLAWNNSVKLKLIEGQDQEEAAGVWSKSMSEIFWFIHAISDPWASTPVNLHLSGLAWHFLGNTCAFRLACLTSGNPQTGCENVGEALLCFQCRTSKLRPKSLPLTSPAHPTLIFPLYFLR